MINRTRPDIPQSLRRNSSKWRRKLLEQVSISKRTGKKVPDRYLSKYKKNDVKLALAAMYENLCCYCDSLIGIVDFPHIEHRKPKDPGLFPEAAFDWDNLHLACTRCNNAKSNKWNRAYPSLDAVTDIPITHHLDYYLDGTCVDKTRRGKTTRDHADLDRHELVEARINIATRVLQVIEEINMRREGWRVEKAKRELAAMSKGQYGAFIDYLKRAFPLND